MAQIVRLTNSPLSCKKPAYLKSYLTAVIQILWIETDTDCLEEISYYTDSQKRFHG